MEFTVRIIHGDVFINGNFVAQLCFNNEAIGCAIADWLSGKIEEMEERE